MKIPNDLIEQYKGSIQINDSVDIFNQISKLSNEDFLEQLPKLVKDTSVLNSKDSTQILILLDRIDFLLSEIIIQLQSSIITQQATQTLSIILINTSKLLKIEYYRILYRQLDRIFQILKYSDDLDIAKLCLHIYYQIFSDPDVRIQELDYIKNEQKQLFYQIKCLYENQNNYNSFPGLLIDLFSEDDGYKNYIQKKVRRKTTDMIEEPEDQHHEIFEFEYTLNIGDSLKYEEMDKKKQLVPLKNSELKKISLSKEEITQKFQSKNCNQIAQELLDDKNTPLFDALVWRLRIYQNILQKKNNSILYTYIQAFKIYTCLQRIYYSEPVVLTFINTIFIVDYDKRLTELLEICYLKVTPDIHRLIFVCIFSMLYLEEHNDYPLIIQALRKNYSLFQKIFKDCSSLKLKKTENDYIFEADSQVLCLDTLKDNNFQKTILKFIQGKGLEIFLEGASGLIDIVNCILKIFNCEFLDNHLTYNLKSLNICSQILSNLVKQEDIQMDFNLLEKILHKMEFAIQMFHSNEVYYQYQSDQWTKLEKEQILEKVAQMLTVINSLFRDKSHRRALPQNLMPTLARKIIESQFLLLLQKLLESEPTNKETEILMNTVQLICNLSGEAPNLIPKLISNKILTTVVSILQKIEVPSTHKSVTQIINFMNHVSLKQEGKDIIMSANLLPKIFLIFTTKNSVTLWNNKGYSSIANSLIEYTTNIDKVHDIVKTLIIETMQKLIEMHNIFMIKIEAYMNMKEDPHPDFPFSVANFNLFSKLLQNFLRFFKELFKNEFPLTRDLLQDKSFDLMFELLKCPVVGLLDNKELKVIFQTIKAIGKIYQQFDPENMSFKLFKVVQHELKELEGIIGDVLFNLTDFSSLVTDRICYETRVNDLSKLMENRDPSLIKPIYLIGKLNYLEALIEILSKIYSGAKNNIKEVDIIQMLNKFKSLYKVILNQICREEQFYLNETRKNLLLENNANKNQECVKAFKEIIYFSRQDKHLFLHNSLRKFFLQVITKSVSGTQKNFNIEFVQCYSILITLVFKNINIEQLQLNDPSQNEKNVNILMHANINLQHLVDLTQSFLEENRRRGMGIMVWPISIITTLYDEGAFEKFFGFLLKFITSIQDYQPNVSDDVNSQLLDVAINYLCDKLTMLIKSLIFQQIDVTGSAKLGGSKQSGKVLQETSNWILLDQMDNLLKIFEALNCLPSLCKKNGNINKLLETLLEKIFKLSSGNVTKILLKSQQQIQREQRYRRFAPYGTSEVPEDIQQQIDDMITQLVAMGFQRERAEIAVNNIEELDLDLACEFLQTHRDELIKSEARRLKKLEEEELKKMKELKVSVEKLDLNKSALQQVSEEDFNKLYQKKLIDYGKMFVRKIWSYQGFEHLIGDILILLVTKQENDLTTQSEIVYILFEMLKTQVNQMFSNYSFKFSLKLNKQSQENVKSLITIPPKQTYNESLQMLNILLPIIIKFGESKNTFLSQDMGIEFLRLSKQILLACKEEQIENLQNYNHRIVIIFLDIIKINKDKSIDLPLLQYILQLLICNNNLYLKHNKNLINGNILQGILTLLIWTCKKKENRNWIYENKLISELFKLQDIQHPGLLDLFYKLLEICICDIETEKACVEIAIKKLFYEETVAKNQKDLNDKSMYQDAKSFNSNENPNVKKDDEGGEQTIEKEHPKQIQKNLNLLAKDTLIDMNKFLTYFTNLFNKGCTQLNPESSTFLQVFQQICSIQVKEDKEQNKKEDLQFVGLKENQTLIANQYQFLDSTQQSILNYVLENIICQFNHEITGDKKDQKIVFNYNLLLRLLHLLIRNYPVLTPNIVKFKVIKYMKKLSNIQIKPTMNFLSYIIRIIVQYSIDKFYHFVYELCLDTNLLFENKSQQIKLFSSKIRKRILHEIYEILDTELQTHQNILERHSSIQLIIAYTSLHAHLLSLTEVAKLSIKNEDTPHSFNFIKIYSDIFKQFDVSKYYQVERILPYLTHTISILHQVALHFVISNKVLIPQPLTNTNTYIDEINKFQLLPTNVLKKDKFSLEWIQINEVRPVRQMRQGLIPIGEMVNQHEENDNYEYEVEGIDLPEEDEGVYDDEEEINIDQEEEEEEEMNEQDDDEESANDSLGSFHENDNYQVYQNQSDSGEHEENIITPPDSEENESQAELQQFQDIDDRSEHLNLPELEVQEPNEIIQSPKEIPDKDLTFSKTIQDLNLQKNSKQIIKFEHLHISQPFAKVYQEFSEYIKCLYDTPLQGMDTQQEGHQLIQKTNEIYQKISQQDTSIFSIASDSWRQLNYEFTKISDHERRYVYDLHDEDDPVNILESHLIDSNGLLNEHTLHQLRSTRLRADLLRRILFNDHNSLERDDRHLSQIENIMRYNEHRGTHTRVQGQFDRIQPPPVTAENINLIRNRFLTHFLNRDQNQEIPAQQIQHEQPQEHPLVDQPDVPSNHPIIENIQQNFENIVIEMNQQQQDSLSEPMDHQDIYQQVDDEENIYHDVLEEIKQEQEQAPQQVQQPQQVLSDDILNSIMQLSQQFMQNTQVQQPPQTQINNESMLLIQQMSQQFNQLTRVEPPKPPEEQKQQQVEEEKNREALPDFLERSLLILQQFDLDLTFFDRYKIDPLVFDSLPEEFKLETILQYLPQEQQRLQQSHQQQEQHPQQQVPQQQVPQMQQPISQEIQEFLDALPENMRAEQQNLLVSQQQNPNILQGGQQDMDNETFLATLPPDLREEVLITASPEFLASLPQEIRDEAEQLRARRSRRFDYFNMDNIFDLHHERINQLENRRMHELKKKGEKQQDIKEIVQKDKTLLSKLQPTDEKLIETILKLLYADNLAFSKFPYYLFQTLATNPITEYKLMDALMFILKTPEIPQLKKIIGQDSLTFPSTNLYERTRVVKNYKKVHNLISLKILYIFSKISQSSINFFIHPESYFHKKDKKYSELSTLTIYKQEIKHENKNVPFIQLINLLLNEEESQLHLQYLVSVLYNVIKKYFLLETDKQNEAHQSKFRLDAEPIRFICQALSSDNINQETIKKLSMIINNLCFDKNNLQYFIQELRSIIMFYSAHINECVERGLQQLHKIREQNQIDQEIKLIRDIELNVDGEKKVQKIFLIIKQLFETSFSKSVELEENQSKQENKEKKEEGKDDQKDEKKKDNQNEEQKGQEEKEKDQKEKDQKEKQEIQEKPDKDKQFKEMMEAVKSQIRSSFQNLINDNLLHQMWINITELFSILSEKHQTSVIQPIIDKLSPLIECYMIIYKIMHDDDDDIVTLKKKQSVITQKKKNISQLLSIEKEYQNEIKDQHFSKLRESFEDSKNVFNFICEKAKIVINQMIKQKLKQIKTNQTKNIYSAFIKEPLGIIIKQIPKIIDFENKKQYFKLELKNLKGSSRHAPVRIRVERSKAFIESFNKINYLMASEMKGKFSIEFAGEEGMDAGGVSREWFLLLSKQIFNPDYGLFKLSSTGNTYQPNKNSWINPDHLKFFKFIGRIMGKALYDGYMLDAFFTRSFYKHILGQPITYHDIQDQDYEYYKNLKWIVENKIEGVIDLYWSYEFDNFGKVEQADLIPDGRNIRVTEEEKLGYVQKVCYAKMAEEIKPQIEAFLDGFHELIPSNLISIFDSHEFELMISGLPDVDLQDLKENTDYHNYTANDPVIQWLWEILDQFDKSQIAAFLQFVTGTSKIPLDGFKALRGMHGPQKFNIIKAYDPNKLPSAHTCFNQLDLPEYPSKDILIEKLMMAIMEGKEGFGFA